MSLIDRFTKPRGKPLATAAAAEKALRELQVSLADYEGKLSDATLRREVVLTHASTDDVLAIDAEIARYRIETERLNACLPAIHADLARLRQTERTARLHALLDQYEKAAEPAYETAKAHAAALAVAIAVRDKLTTEFPTESRSLSYVPPVTISLSDLNRGITQMNPEWTRFNVETPRAIKAIRGN